MLSGCLPEQLPGQTGPSRNTCESDRLHQFDTNGSKRGMSVEPACLPAKGGSCWRGRWRWSHLLLTTFLWDKICYKPCGSRKSVCCWLGASQTKRRSSAILVTAQNVHFNFAHKLFLIKCRLLCWLFSCRLFTYLATFACSEGYWAWTRMFPCYSSISWISSHLSAAANPVLVV